MTVTLRSPRKYGWVRQLPDFRDCHIVHSDAAVASRPPSRNLADKMPPVYDQGQVGSCVGNSTAAAFEYNLTREGGGGWTPSRLFVYWNARRLEGTTDSDSGAQIRDGVRGVALWGAPKETDWPYDPDACTVKPNAHAFLEAKRNVASSYLAVRQSVDAIATTVAGGEPVVFGFSVYDYFESDEMASTGVLKMPLRSEQMLGGHAVLIVGYDDVARTFSVRNSWGASWGKAGYFDMPYSYAADPQLASDFWVVRHVT